MFSNQLKSSAVSPSRIVTSGNEIEIEVNPDIVGDTGRHAPLVSTLPVCDEKENESLGQRQGVVQGMLAPGGLLLRGGPGMGPRLRLPASVAVAAAQQQQQVVMATRTPGGLLVRHPTAGSLVATQMPPVQMPTLVRGPQPVVGGSMSCPFCALAFIDSPALYEHLSIQHTVDQKTKWRQPKGREGKTIVPQKRTGGQQASAASGGSSNKVPPILTPIEPFNVSAAGVRYRSPLPAKSSATVPSNSASQQQSTVTQEAGLFEDPVDVGHELVKKPRGRLPKSGGTPSRGGDSDGTPPPAKRPRTANDDEDADDEGSTPVVRRGRPSAASADKNSKDETPKSTPPRRGGRTPRGQKK
jgi:hypothetical protein